MELIAGLVVLFIIIAAFATMLGMGKAFMGFVTKIFGKCLVFAAIILIVIMLLMSLWNYVSTKTKQFLDKLFPARKPLAAVSLIVSPEKQQMRGSKVMIKAAAQGGQKVNYQFAVSSSDGTQVFFKDYSSASSCEWVAGHTGKFKIKVTARGKKGELKSAGKDYEVIYPYDGFQYAVSFREFPPKYLVEFQTYFGDDTPYGAGHLGTDWSTKDRDIKAAADGWLVFRGERTGFGNIVVLGHVIPGEGNIYTLYAHLASFSDDLPKNANAEPSEDTFITRGTSVGTEGSTGGASTGVHLHFAIMKSIDPKNPRPAGYTKNKFPPNPGNDFCPYDKQEYEHTYNGINYYNPMLYIENHRAQSVPSIGK